MIRQLQVRASSICPDCGGGVVEISFIRIDMFEAKCTRDVCRNRRLATDDEVKAAQSEAPVVAQELLQV